MDGFEKHKDAIAAAGGAIAVAASIDTEDKSKEVADGVSFPVAEGVTREQADALDTWWEDRRGIVQPSEFLLDKSGKVLVSSYSSGPLGRVEPEDIVKMVGFIEKRKQEAAG